jgi:type I restriction enzyme, S subunit
LQSVFNNGLIRLRVNKEKYDPKYIFYNLQSNKYLAHINSIAYSTSTQPNMKIKDFLRMDIEDLDLQEQKRIAHILGTLDDKIELNRKMNQTLESMAQALFQSWFVDFDPVLGNALAAGNSIPEPLQKKAEKRKAIKNNVILSGDEGTNPALAKLFPSTFVFNEILNKWIPEGWVIKQLSETTTELRRGVSPKYCEEGGVLVLNQKCIRNHEINFDLGRRNDPQKKKIEGRLLQEGDILVNSTGVGTLGRMAQVHSMSEDTIVDSHVTVIRPATESYKTAFFGRLMLSIEAFIEAMGEGSTGQTELSRARVSKLNLICPPENIQNTIESILKDYSRKSDQNKQEISSLTKTRDTLLPKLISGIIKV